MRLAPAAEDDLAAIAQYAAATWGEQQADRYFQRVSDALASLLQYPEIGRARHDVSPGLRSHPIGQYVVYYVVTADELLVRRVFHSRRDADAELGV